MLRGTVPLSQTASAVGSTAPSESTCLAVGSQHGNRSTERLLAFSVASGAIQAESPPLLQTQTLKSIPRTGPSGSEFKIRDALHSGVIWLHTCAPPTGMCTSARAHTHTHLTYHSHTHHYCLITGFSTIFTTCTVTIPSCALSTQEQELPEY